MIDTSTWGEFRVGDLFEIERATRRTVNDYESGDVPYVTNSAVNNGVSGYLAPKSSTDIERGQCITVNTVDGSAFWQEVDFLANSSGNGLLMLRRDGLAVESALFICSVLGKSLDASFGVMLTTGKVRDLVIGLPITLDGSPDWDTMERMMGEVMASAEQRLEVLSEPVPASKVVDTSSWKEFVIGEIFNIQRGTGYPTTTTPEGETPLVSAKATNNSIGMRAAVPAKFEAGTITLVTDGSVGYATVQSEPFDIASNAVALVDRSPNIEESAKLMVCALLRKASEKFDYSNKLTGERLRRLTIALPVTSTGAPDWDQMAAMMSQVVQVVGAGSSRRVEGVVMAGLGKKHELGADARAMERLTKKIFPSFCCWPECKEGRSVKVEVPLCDRHAVKAYRAVLDANPNKKSQR